MNFWNFSLSKRQISYRIRFIGRRYGRKRQCQMISHRNRNFRILYREHILASSQYFYNHVFVDESMIVVRNVQKFQWKRLSGNDAKNQRVSKSHGFSIYGGISRRGPTPFAIFPNSVRIEQRTYCKVAASTVYPFICEVYNKKCQLVQDNAPMHVSNYSKAFFQTLRVQYHYGNRGLADFYMQSTDISES